MTIFRLFRSKYSPKDPTGAKLFGGRWNSPGTEMLYASSSLALACLEVLVHIRDTDLVPSDYIFCEIRFTKKFLLPWYSRPLRTKALIESTVLSREYGDKYLSRGRPNRGYPVLPALLIGPEPEPRRIPEQRRQCPVHVVPSVIIPREWNYLINPNHPHFSELTWSDPQPFAFDPRLLRASTA